MALNAGGQPPKRVGLRSMLFKAAVDGLVNAIDEAAQKQQRVNASRALPSASASTLPPPLPPRTTARPETSATTGQLSEQELMAEVARLQNQIQQFSLQMTNSSSDRVVNSTQVTKYSRAVTFPGWVGQPETWSKEALPAIGLTVQVPSGSLLNQGQVSKTSISAVLRHPSGKTNQNLCFTVSPLYSQETADEYIQRFSATYLSRARARVYFVSKDDRPTFPEPLATSETHTAYLASFYEPFQTGDRASITNIILRPKEPTAMGVFISVEIIESFASIGRAVAQALAISTEVAHPSCSENEFIGVYGRQSSLVGDRRYGYYYYASTWYSTSKGRLWLFGDGIYILDTKDNMTSPGFYFPSEHQKEGRETGSWHLDYSSGFAAIVLTKTDGTKKEWTVRRYDQLTLSPSDGTGSVKLERRVKALEYWTIVGLEETQNGATHREYNSC